jgi:hypothetical protein
LCSTVYHGEKSPVFLLKKLRWWPRLEKLSLPENHNLTINRTYTLRTTLIVPYDRTILIKSF